MATSPALRSNTGGPMKALLGGGVALLIGSVLIVAILGSVLGGSGASCGQPPTSVGAAVPAPGTAGTELRGKVSWFGGPNDSTTGPTTATGLPVTHPGIAVYNTATKGGWWWVRFPNGRAAILQQTDFGPAPWTGRVVDVLYSALPAIGYTEANFPTDAEVVARYLGKSDRWAQAPGAITGAPMPLGVAPSTAAGSCEAEGLTDTGVPGNVEIAAGANRPGVPMASETLAFLGRMAGIAGRKLVVTTGSNHSQYTASGNVSDHWDGHGADFGMVANGGSDDSPVGDRIMAACLIAGGLSPAEATATARAGGLETLVHNGLRIQCIWKTEDHHDHVHAAARAIA
jgi:hypothetical protein